MRLSPLSFLLACVALGTLGCVRSPFDAQAYEVDAWTLDVSLVPEKSIVLVGEPVFLSFVVHNRSSEDLQLLVGGDTLNRLRRPDSFRIEAVRADGRRAPTPESPAAAGSSVRGPRKIPAGGRTSFSLFLPDWAAIGEPGEYALAATRTLEITKVGEDVAWLDPANVSRVDVRASARVEVRPADAEAFGVAIADRGRVMLDADEDAARAAAQALSAIDDPRVIPHLVRAAAESPYSVRIVAVRALGKFADDAALAAVKRATTDPEVGIRLSAASSLSRSPHPAAVEALIDLRGSPDVGVRNTVLQALATMPSPESLDMIRAMTTDEDDDLRAEAQRHLRRRGPAPSGGVK